MTNNPPKITHTFIASTLQKALNYLVRRDQYCRLWFENFKDKVFEIKLTDMEVKFYLIFSEDDISIQITTLEKIYAGIETDIYSLKNLYSNKKLINSKLSGDIKLAELFIKRLAQIEIDHEELLSKYVGDFMALQISYIFKQGKTLKQQQTQSFEDNLKEYLQFEISSIMTKSQLNDFIQEILELEQNTLKLENKINKLNNSLKLK